MDLIKKNYGKIANILLALSAATMVAMVCYFLRNTVLACHDSMLDFTDARLYDFKYFYDHAMEFCLARGRAGFIFPFIVAVRQLIDGTGNYLAIWLVQQVPIWFDVGLIAWIIAKKTKPYYGFYFVCFYAAYIQIDFNHSLMVCYPMDFTYGLALMIFGLYLYDGWLRNLGSSKKTNVIRLIVSLICFYESMETYEPFITAAIIYILLSAIHTYKHRSKYGRKSILKFILHLLPHGIVGIIYVGIMVYLKINPVSDVPVTQPYSVGDFGAFVTTWKTFTVSLLPLTHYQNAGVHVRTIFTGFYTIVFAFVMAFATVVRHSASAEVEICSRNIWLSLVLRVKRLKSKVKRLRLCAFRLPLYGRGRGERPFFRTAVPPRPAAGQGKREGLFRRRRCSLERLAPPAPVQALALPLRYAGRSCRATGS